MNAKVVIKKQQKWHLQFFHLFLHCKAVHCINGNSHGVKILLKCVEPVRENGESTLCLVNARKLFLKLFDCLLQKKVK